jgi:hypothetical protein
MGLFNRQPGSRNVVEPDVRFDEYHGLILFDEWSEHRLFSPSLRALLQRYLDYPESRAGARAWLDEANQYSPFGFAALCEYIDLEADYVRRGLIRWMNNVDSGAFAMPRSTRLELADQRFKSRMPHVSPMMLGSRLSAPPAAKDGGLNRASQSNSRNRSSGRQN